jgi:hypothetical protein
VKSATKVAGALATAASSSLRGLFVFSVKEIEMDARERFRQAIENHWISFLIIAGVWESTDTMPRSLCDELDLPQGSPYADGARKAHRLMGQQYRAAKRPQLRLVK